MGTWSGGADMDRNMERIERDSSQTKRHTTARHGDVVAACASGVALVIAGATSPEQVRANAAAPNRDLQPSEIEAIDETLKRP